MKSRMSASAAAASVVAGGGIVLMDRKYNDASSPIDDDNENDDYNEKQSKLERSNRRWLGRAVILTVILMTVGLALGQLYERQQAEAMILASTEKQLLRTKVDAPPPKHLQKQQLQQQKQQKQPEQIQPDQRPDEEYLEVDKILASKVKELDQEVRKLKAQPGMIMETDPQGKALTKQLQTATLRLLKHRYGFHRNFRVAVDVIFPDSIPGYDATDDKGQVIIEMAPIDLIPCSVFYFLELARTYQSGSFHRNANHVLQAQAKAEAVTHSMPFQEYNPEFPHRQYTAGYAGRPSGPGWYLSIQDNTKNHGPGSQQKANPYEADSLFGRIVEGVDNGVVAKIHSVPQSGWLDRKNHILIPKMTILVPTQNDDADDHTDVDWVPWTTPEALSEDDANTLMAVL